MNLRTISTERASGFPIEVPFIEHLGMRMVEYSDTHSLIVLDVQPWMRNSWQVAHGGIVMTMLDVAMAMAGRPLDAVSDDPESLNKTSVGSVTVEMKTTFIQPARGALTARGVCLKRATSLAFCEAELFDEAQTLIAKSSGTFKFWRR